MKYRIHNLHRPIDSDPSHYEKEIERITGLKGGDYRYRRHQESVDARRGREIRYVASVDIETERALKESGRLFRVDDEGYRFASVETTRRPVIVGAGPAGLFCAYVLAKAKMPAIVLERGDAVEARIRKVEAFWAGGPLDPESNVQFGEGGAGTFSDGKLTSRSKDPRGRLVLSLFSRLAEDESLLYKKKPHVGTDALRKVLVRLRRELEEMGTIFRFNERLDDIEEHEGEYLFHTSRGEVASPYGVLALGHSARNSFEMLLERGFAMSAKPFAVGFRIEQNQQAMNAAQYKEAAALLPPAEYAVTQKLGENGVYSFCMCPGGYVVAAASEIGGVVTNGMSYKDRGGENANAAILATVDESVYGAGVLAGMEFQRSVEQKVFQMTGSYRAPIMPASEYLKRGGEEAVAPTYRPGTYRADLHEIYPEAVDTLLEEGMRKIGEKFPAFLENALLTAPETRSSSPVRILRDPKRLASISHGNIYPTGEGAGYAGGIVSSAIDGIRVAEKIIEKEKVYVRD